MTEPVLDIDVNIEAVGWSRMIPDLEKTIDAAAGAAVAAAGYTGRNPELSVLLADDRRLAELNENWRGKAGPTNVLSFPGDVEGPGPARHPRERRAPVPAPGAVRQRSRAGFSFFGRVVWPCQRGIFIPGSTSKGRFTAVE